MSTRISICPFGGTTSADDYLTGTRAAAIGGTTAVIDFALQSRGHTLAEALAIWDAKAEGKACIDYSLHMAITDADPHGGTELRERSTRCSRWSNAASRPSSYSWPIPMC